MSKDTNFNIFKTIAGVTFVLALLVAFINLLASENETIQLHEIMSKYHKNSLGI
jgi:hypothetical protein